MYILGVIVAISFFLIADIGSPLGDVIRVHPQKLHASRNRSCHSADFFAARKVRDSR
jgi:hypothetical protein